MTETPEMALRALADPTRIAILRLVGSKELRASAIAEHFETTRPAISQHLRVLTDAGLIVVRRDGTRRLYRLRPDGFRGVRQFLDAFWDEKLDRLNAAVERDVGGKNGRR